MKPAPETPWQSCLDYCKEETVSTNNLSRLVGLSVHGKRYLSNELRIRTLPELQEMLSGPDQTPVSRAAHHWGGERLRLEARIRAHEEDAPPVFGGIYPALPVGDNIAIFLAVQAEPVEDRRWFLGMLLQARADLRPENLAEDGPPRPFLVVAKSRAECSEAVARFVRGLYQVLLRVDLWNLIAPGSSEASLSERMESWRSKSVLTRNSAAGSVHGLRAGA